ncbi:MAG: hypothetical protein A4E38_00003 [Methanoregulaceae archaeon PtaB.Bin108]|nr:MAG: hypothetical protein A4E38_00003 [Methanoregulaceae archaeon PtaB.Bin108]
MITTSREAINALDLWHQSVIETMINRGLVKVTDEGEQKQEASG